MTEVRRINPEDGFIREFTEYRKRIESLETAPAGNIVIRETLTAEDPETGVKTVIGQLSDGSVGFQPFVGDITPPPVATVPVVSAQPGIFTVSWDGLFVNNEDKPNDFVHVNVIGHKMDGENVLSSLTVGVLRLPTDTVFVAQDIAAIGEAWQFSLESEDYNGNKAVRSARTDTVVMESIVSDQGVTDALQVVQDAADAADAAAQTAQGAADAAQQTADDAVQAAIDAANIADSKGVIYTQTATPSADYSGLWIDTAHNNIPRRYLGVRSALVMNLGGGAGIGTRLTSLGWAVSSITTTASLEDAAKYDLVAMDSGYAGLLSAPTDLATKLWDRGISLFTTGNDTTSMPPLFTGASNRSTPKNPIRYVSAGSSGPSAYSDYGDSDLNIYLTGVNPAAKVTGVTLAASTGSDQPVNLIMEHPTNFARWAHVETYATPATVLNSHLGWVSDNWVAIQDQGVVSAASAAVSAQLKADQAFNDAATAALAAGTAQTTANGKNTSWNQPTQPAGTGHKIGDMWFDTDDNYTLRTWDGDEWVTAQDSFRAQQTADSKGITYTQAVAPPVSARLPQNLWNDTSLGEDKVVVKYWSTTADAWTPLADKAATEARIIADSKGETIYSDTEPTVAQRLPQNLWIDTTGGINISKRWDGFGWAIVADTRIASTASAVTAADAKAQDALDEATSKSLIYTQSTTPPVEARLPQTIWNDTSLGTDKVVVKYWDGDSWEPLTDKIATETAAVVATKTKTWFQSNSPALTGNTAGDLWIDSDDNKAYVWNGAWTVAQDSAISKTLYGTFPTDIDQTQPNKWLYTRYNKTGVPSNLIPTYLDIVGIAGTSSIVPDGNALVQNVGDSYIGQLRTVVNVVSAKTIAITASHDDAAQIYVDGVSVYTKNSVANNAVISFPLSAGWHVLDFMWSEASGGDGWFAIQPTIGSQVTSMYAPVSLTATSQAVSAAQTSATNAMNAQAYSLNASFDDWTGTIPSNYAAWGSVNPVKETTIVRRAPFAARFNVPDTNIQAGLTLNTNVNHAANLEYMTLELEFQLVSGTLGGSGFLLDWNATNYVRHTTSLAAEVPAPVLGKWYRVTKVVKRPSGLSGTFINISGYLMAQYSSIGAGAIKNIVFDWVNVRPATTEEIISYGAPAKYTELESATAAKGEVIYSDTAPPAAKQLAQNLWIDTTGGLNIHKRWLTSSWVVVSDPRIAQTASDLSALSSTVSSVSAQADRSITTFYGTTTPTGAQEGDLWLTGVAGTPMKRYSSAGTWDTFEDPNVQAAYQKAQDAQSAADGKVRTFAQADEPTGMVPDDVGDLWIDTNDNNKMWRYSGAAWVALQDGDIALAQQAADNAQLSANGKNKVHYSTSIASGTVDDTDNNRPFVEGDTWFQRNAQNLIIGQWEFIAGEWVARKVSGLVLAELDAGTISVGYLRGENLSATAINGKTVTGATIQTEATANRGIKLTSTELAGYDGAGVKNFSLTSAGVLAVRGAIKSGSSIEGATLSAAGGGIETTTTANRGVKLKDTGIVTYDTSGNMTFKVDASTGLVEAPGLKANSITGDKIAAKTLTADLLVLGGDTNLFDDGPFASKNINHWEVNGTPAGVVFTEDTLSFNRSGASVIRLIGRKWEPVQAGEKFLTSIPTITSAATGTYDLYTYMLNDAGTQTGALVVSGLTTVGPHTGEWTVPAGIVAIKPYLYMATDVPAGASVKIGRPQVIRKIAGSLIVDGAIDGKTITGATIRTEQATDRGIKLTSTELAGWDTNGVKNFSLTSAGALSLIGAIKSGSTIEGATITGTTGVQTSSTANRGVKITNTGVSAFDGSGNMTFRVDGASGLVEAPGIKANSIAGDKIAAKSLSVDKMMVSDFNNYVENPDFETGDFSGWDVVGNWYINTAAPYNGTYKALTGYTGVMQTLTNKMQVVLPVDGKVRVKFRLYAEAPTSGVQVGIALYNVGTGVLESVTNLSNNSQWYEFDRVLTATTAGAKRLQIFTSGTGTGFVRLDAITMNRMENGSLIVDGAIVTTHMTSNTINGSVISTNTLSGTKVTAKSITVDKLVVSSSDNLIVEADFSNGGASWEPKTNMSINATAGRGTLPAMRVTGTTAVRTSLNLVNKIPVGSEDRFRGSMWIKSSSALASGAVSVKARCWTSATTPASNTDIVIAANNAVSGTNQWINVEGFSPVLPAGTIALDFYISVTNPATDTITDIDYVAVTRAADGKLVVDGAIDGKTITGALFQTDSSPIDSIDSRGIKLNGAGLKAYDPFGKNTFSIDALTGEVSSSGTFATASSDYVEGSGTMAISAIFGNLTYDSHTEYSGIPGIKFERTHSSEGAKAPATILYDGSRITLSTYDTESSGFVPNSAGSQISVGEGSIDMNAQRNGALYEDGAIPSPKFLLNGGSVEGPGYERIELLVDSKPDGHYRSVGLKIDNWESGAYSQTDPFKAALVNYSNGYQTTALGESRMEVSDGGLWKIRGARHTDGATTTRIESQSDGPSSYGNLVMSGMNSVEINGGSSGLMIDNTGIDVTGSFTVNGAPISGQSAVHMVTASGTMAAATVPVPQVGALTTDASGSTATLATPQTGQITITEAGVYDISFQCWLNAPMTGRSYIDITAVGTTAALARNTIAVGEDSATANVNGLKVEAGQVIKFFVYQTSGGVRSYTSAIRLVKVGSPSQTSNWTNTSQTIDGNVIINGDLSVNNIGSYDYTAGVAKMPFIVLAKSGTQTLSAANTWYALNWDAPDTYNYQMTHSHTTNSHIITVQKSGIYEVNYKVAVNVTTGHVSGAIAINGTWNGGWVQRVGNNSGQYEKAQLVQTGQFYAGDTIQIGVASGYAGALADPVNNASIRMIVPT